MIALPLPSVVSVRSVTSSRVSWKRAPGRVFALRLAGTRTTARRAEDERGRVRGQVTGRLLAVSVGAGLAVATTGHACPTAAELPRTRRVAVALRASDRIDLGIYQLAVTSLPTDQMRSLASCAAAVWTQLKCACTRHEAPATDVVDETLADCIRTSFTSRCARRPTDTRNRPC
jgi:hypothetical protein